MIHARLMVAAVAVALLGCASSATFDSTRRKFERTTPIVFPAPNGHEYDAVLIVPSDHPAALAVIFGGGSVTDMHWTVPESIVYEGKTIRMTTGGATHDADDIAAALLARDIAVYQFSSIYRGDPLHAADASMATPLAYADSRDVARAAFTVALERPETADLAVICVGHSLGAARALQCAREEPRVAGFVFLSGAYLSNPKENPSGAAEELVVALRGAGADLDDGVTERQWIAALPVVPRSMRSSTFAELDVDGDDTLRRWEVASAYHLSMLDAGDASFQHESHLLAGEPVPSEIVISERKPTLALYGGLDTMTYHGPMLARAARDAGDDSWLTVEYLADRGHNLSPELPRTDGHGDIAGPTVTGPIDPRACDRIAGFAVQIAGR